MDRLEGKVALVTGAGQGIGYAIARSLADDGATVVVNDRVAALAHKVAEELIASGAPAVASVFDVADFTVVRTEVEKVTKEVGGIDILINNAGVHEGVYHGPFVDSAPSDWQQYMAVNLYGSMNCIHALLPGMMERKWGRVIQISSGAASRATVGNRSLGMSLYAASKAGIEGLLRHLAVEVAEEGITVNSLALGHVVRPPDGPQLADEAKLLKEVPMGRFAEVAEVGMAVVWLAAEGASFITGQVIHVNGGSYQGR